MDRRGRSSPGGKACCWDIWRGGRQCCGHGGRDGAHGGGSVGRNLGVALRDQRVDSRLWICADGCGSCADLGDQLLGLPHHARPVHRELADQGGPCVECGGGCGNLGGRRREVGGEVPRPGRDDGLSQLALSVLDERCSPLLTRFGGEVDPHHERVECIGAAGQIGRKALHFIACPPPLTKDVFDVLCPRSHHRQAASNAACAARICPTTSTPRVPVHAAAMPSRCAVT